MVKQPKKTYLFSKLTQQKTRGVQETEKPNLNPKRPKNRNQKKRNRLKNRRFGFYILKKPKFSVRFGFSIKNRPIETEPTFKVKMHLRPTFTILCQVTTLCFICFLNMSFRTDNKFSSRVFSVFIRFLLLLLCCSMTHKQLSFLGFNMVICFLSSLLCFFCFS